MSCPGASCSGWPLAPGTGARTKLLVADEPASMLDPSEQAKMIQLLKHLQVERGMAMIFVSHDLAVVLRVADRVVVGRVVEEGTGSEILVSPRHEVTQGLLAASARDALFERASAAYLPLGV